MFGFGKKSHDLDNETVAELENIKSKIAVADYPTLVRYVDMAINDLADHKQLPQVVALKLTNTVYALKMENAANVPVGISEQLHELREKISRGGVGYVMPGNTMTARYYE